MQIPASLYPGLVTANKEDSVLDVVKVMFEKRIGSVLITEGEELLGIFTERDLMIRVVAQSKDPAQLKMQEVMTGEVKSLTPEATILDAETIMEELRIRHVPIVSNEGKPLGVISMRRLHSFRQEELKKENELLTQLLVTDSPGG